MMSKDIQVPEGYKKTDLGIIPEEWEVKPLGEYAKLQGGFAFKSKDAAENGVRWLKIANVGIGSIKWDVESYLPSNFIENYPEYILKKGQIVIAMTRPVLGDKLKITKLKETDIPSLLNQRVGRFSITDNLDSEYLYQVARDAHFLEEIKIKIRGTDPPNISSTHIESIKIAVPSLPEQQKIASILSKVDEQIEQTEQIIEETEILKKGLMQKLLTKGIGHTKFKKTELGKIPEEWSVFKLSDLLKMKYILSHLDGNHGSKYPKAHEFVESGVPYVSANAIVDGIVDFSKAKYLTPERAKQFTKGIAKNGDVLLAHNATVGPTALLKTDDPYVILSTSLTYYRCDLQKISNYFLKYYMESSLFQNQLGKIMKQTTRNQVPITMQRNFYFCLPSIEEQREIGNILFSIEQHITKNANCLASLQELKKGLMQDLLTGKVRVCV